MNVPAYPDRDALNSAGSARTHLAATSFSVSAGYPQKLPNKRLKRGYPTFFSSLSSLRCEMGEQTAASICFPIRFGLWSVWSSPIRHRSGYGAQVGRKDSPAHPSTEALL